MTVEVLVLAAAMAVAAAVNLFTGPAAEKGSAGSLLASAGYIVVLSLIGAWGFNVLAAAGGG